MSKFYMYKVGEEGPDGTRRTAIVRDLDIFAEKIFDPNTMEFCGVVIEAETEQDAYKAFLHPREEDTIYLCDEPQETASRRRSLVIKINIHPNVALCQGLVAKVAELNQIISDMAGFAEPGNKEGLPKEAIYLKLKQIVITFLNAYSFRDSGKK